MSKDKEREFEAYLGKVVAAVALSILQDDDAVGEERMREVLAEAMGVIVKAEHGDEEAIDRIKHAGEGFNAIIQALGRQLVN